ncbi:unnamed protein product [Prorocentrum cordatum]|uniref:Rad51-like C-terminal domain-containing protein n=1 Tax=Prorocentrum cordatum TaxID=2364126 RepID=A0ABN9UGG0_9DINO|nr:unnamed protein product [Polarella glacialis]
MAQQGEQQRRSKRLRLAEPGAEEEDAAGAAPPAPSASSGQAPAAAASAAEGAVVAEADAEQQAVAPAEAEEPGITRLERLAQPVDHMGAGLSKADLKSLVEHGIHCVETIAFMPMRKLLDVQGIGEAKAKRIMTAAKKLVPMRMVSAAEMLAIRKNMIQLSTGSAQLDGLLDGGVETGQITDINAVWGRDTQHFRQPILVSVFPVPFIAVPSSSAVYLTPRLHTYSTAPFT